MREDYSPIRQILVALDASTSSVNALQAAVELAERFNAELIGLFIEDINLLRLAQLPFAREVSIFAPMPKPLKSLEIEMQLRAQAERMRRLLAQSAQRHGVAWIFRIARGAVAAEILAAGAQADLLILGKIGRSMPGLQRMGSTVRMMLLQRQGMTLIMESRVFLTMPVVTLYDGSEVARKALEIAAFLVKSKAGRLTVLVVAGEMGKARDLENEVLHRLQALGLAAEMRLLVNPLLRGLARRVREESAGPVVLPCRKDWLEGEQLCALVDEIVNPVLLVR
jgi:nucleotide-binding universal stress UspA family protein